MRSPKAAKTFAAKLPEKKGKKKTPREYRDPVTYRGVSSVLMMGSPQDI